MNNITPKTELLYKKSQPIDHLNIFEGFNLMVDEQKKAALAVKKSSKNISSVASIITNKTAIHNIEKKACSKSLFKNSTVRGKAVIISIKTRIGPSQPLDFFLSFRSSKYKIFISFIY